MRILLIASLIFLFACGGGTSVGPSQPAQAQPDPITFKNIPQGISIFE